MVFRTLKTLKNRKEVKELKATIWAIVVFIATLGLSIAIFLPKVFELPGGQKAGMYSNFWLFGTPLAATLFAWLTYVILEIRNEKQGIR